MSIYLAKAIDFSDKELFIVLDFLSDFMLYLRKRRENTHIIQKQIPQKKKIENINDFGFKIRLK